MSIANGVKGDDCPPVLCVARDYVTAGLSVIPIQANGSKAPAWDLLPRGPDGKATWKPYQAEFPLADELDDWFEDGHNGIAIICGAISGGLEVIDFEEVAVFEQWRERVEAEAPGLVQRMPVFQTPRPGRHVYYRCSHAEGSQKLARTADGRTLIERKGEGGYVLAPGSPAACHPSGRLYEHLSGPPLTAIPLITPDERALLLAAVRSFDTAAPSLVGDDQGDGVAVATCQQPEASPSPVRADALSRASAYLAKCDPAISGQGGHDQTFKVACALLHGFHLDDETAYSLLLNDYNPRCVPLWTEKELRHKVESARAHGSYPDMMIQSHHPSGPSGNGQQGQAKAPVKTSAPPPIIRVNAADLLQQEIEPTRWVVPDLLPEGLAVLAGRPKKGKSWLAMDLALCVATGARFLGRFDCPETNVLYLALVLQQHFCP
jgi:putative DNA primase/helicase